jgi:predicted amidohydrolase YtcJ
MSVNETVLFTARRIITLNAAQPFADAVAVSGGQILAVGTRDELESWGPCRVDDRFASKVLVPGFVEGHSHVMAGGMWQLPYVGWFDRRDPLGMTWKGCRSIDDVVERIIEVESVMTDPNETLLAWGLDPIYFEGERLLAKHLDRVSSSRPIFVLHASGHLASVNSAMLELGGITTASTAHGIARDAAGQPNGELQEGAMMLTGGAFASLRTLWSSPDAMWNYALEARNAGITFLTDLGTSSIGTPGQVEAWQSATSDPGFPARVMVASANLFGGSLSATELAERTRVLREESRNGSGGQPDIESADKLHFGIVKLVIDGSIQGYTARISWPYYYRPPEGHTGNGIWLLAPEQVADLLYTYHAAGLTVHAHCNGDQATEVFLDAVEAALERHPRWDHRHTVQHCQMATPAQFRRMAALGVGANLFVNHIYYWGDQHRDRTIGPERAAKMDACATALREGVRISVHSDAPVTPLGQLHTVWCAVNRLTSTGSVLGPNERISPMDALTAVTLGAAYQLKLDHLIGSIEVGKLADFAVLEEDPLEVDPVRLKDITIWGTVIGGVPSQAGTDSR